MEAFLCFLLLVWSNNKWLELPENDIRGDGLVLVAAITARVTAVQSAAGLTWAPPPPRFLTRAAGEAQKTSSRLGTQDRLKSRGWQATALPHRVADGPTLCARTVNTTTCRAQQRWLRDHWRRAPALAAARGHAGSKVVLGPGGARFAYAHRHRGAPQRHTSYGAPVDFVCVGDGGGAAG